MTENNDLIRIFENDQFGNVRVVIRDDEPWFVAADVCRALDVGNPSQALTRLDEDEKMTTLISNEGAASGKSSMAFVNEPGLYTLVLGSRKPEAKAFKRWITHDVIPSIRKTGTYALPVMPDKLDSYMISDPVERARRWIAEEETRQRLAATNRALVAENLIWKDSAVINALVRRYAASACGGDFGKAWRSFYKEMLYKHSIGLEKRKTAWCDQHPGQKPPAAYQFLRVCTEVSKGVSCIASMCQEARIDVGDILEHFEQKALATY